MMMTTGSITTPTLSPPGGGVDSAKSIDACSSTGSSSSHNNHKIPDREELDRMFARSKFCIVL